MDGNRLTGPLPSSLGKCISLCSVHLQNNLLSGRLPVLDALNFLGDFNLSDNAFNASLPPNLFNWTQAGNPTTGNVGTTYFSTIDLSNTLPPGMSSMVQPAVLNFAPNRFSTSWPRF